MAPRGDLLQPSLAASGGDRVVVASSDELAMDIHSNPDPSVQCPWLADRLYGAKPVAWRGRGDLPQVPWSRSARGSGLCLALLQCGFHFFAIAAEMDPVAANLCASNMPNVIHVPRVEVDYCSGFAPLFTPKADPWYFDGGRQPLSGKLFPQSGSQRH